MAPRQKPRRSRQDYETPWEFIWAVEQYIGSEFTVDLAGTEQNKKAPVVVTDSLNVDWDEFEDQWLWLNPPFADIGPWAAKCAQSTANIALLVPASVGSKWFAEYVFGKAEVLFLSPRISFDGIGPYPKDCILALYGLQPRFHLWQWK